MKITTSAVLACFPLSAILIWSAAAQSDPGHLVQPSAGRTVVSAETSQGGTEEFSEQEAIEMRAKLEHATSEIETRLHRPAMLEVSNNSGDEAEIAELYNSGWIIEATVDEVEAALKAAEATPDLEDDRAASVFAHRASCRYFLQE